MRGKGNAWDWFFTGTRITPAYAGKRLIMYIMCGRIRDHPRLCGEKNLRWSIRSSNAGSPPPMRGKAFNFRHTVKEIGITPAYAGKSLCDQLGVQVRRDHPRLCGEKPAAFAHCFQSRGSPPPMRGKDTSPRSGRAAGRITPAYAGKSGLRSKVERNYGDHPRLCGEK